MRIVTRDTILSGLKWGLLVGTPVGLGLAVVGGAFPAGAVALGKIVGIGISCWAGGTIIGVVGASAWQAIRNRWGVDQTELTRLLEEGHEEGDQVAGSTSHVMARLQVEHQHPFMVNQSRGIVWAGVPSWFIYKLVYFLTLYHQDHLPQAQQPDSPDARHDIAHRNAMIALWTIAPAVYVFYALPRATGMALLERLRTARARIPSGLNVLDVQEAGLQASTATGSDPGLTGGSTLSEEGGLDVATVREAEREAAVPEADGSRHTPSFGSGGTEGV